MIIFIIIDANCADSGVHAGAMVHQADDVEAMDSAVSSWGVMGLLKGLQECEQLGLHHVPYSLMPALIVLLAFPLFNEARNTELRRIVNSDFTYGVFDKWFARKLNPHIMDATEEFFHVL